MSKRRLPAEWEPQSAVQLTWPHEDTDWNYILEDVTRCYIEVATAISKRETLVIVCRDQKKVKSLLKDANLDNIRFYEIDCNDTWARDHGGITIEEDGQKVVCDFQFNGWGKKFEAALDNAITKQMYAKGVFHKNVKYADRLDYVLEGGSIESDGQGTILTTEECLLSKNRNEQFSKAEIDTKIKDFFGADTILWLGSGYLAGDDTDSHIDTLARLCAEDTIAYVKCADWNDEHYTALKKMEEELMKMRTRKGKPYRLVALPMADQVEMDGERLPATYANFLIMNKTVLMPTYNSSKDKVALGALQSIFTDREVIGIDCTPLIRQHGSLHCITMQFPVGVIE